MGAALPIIGLVATAASGVVGAVGAIQSADAQHNAAEYQAQVAANNAKIATQNAQMASAAGSAQVEQAGLETKAKVGAIKAAEGASNVDVNSGSALDVRSSAAALGELDALTIRSAAERQVYGYETQATGFQGQQTLEQMQAKNASTAGLFGAASSLLGAAGSVGTQWTQWQKAAGTSPLALLSS